MRSFAIERFQHAVKFTKQLRNVDEVDEWLRRWTANPLCSARVSSNLILVARSRLTLRKFDLTVILS